MNKFLLSLTLTVALIVGLAGNVSGACLCGIVGLAASTPWSAYHQVNQRGAVFAFNPFLGVCGMRGLMDSDPDKNGGGIGEAITAIKDVQKNQETLLKNYDQLGKDTKAAMEEFTKLKNAQAEDRELLRSLQKLNLQLRNEQRSAFGDPVMNIAANPDKRTLLVAMIAKSLGAEVLDACGKRVREVAKGLRVVDGVAARDLDSGNTPGSVFLDTNEVERDLYSVLSSFGAFRTFDVRMVSSKATEIPLKTARAAMVFVDEAAQIGADSAKAGSRVTVTPKKIAGLINVSNELLEDDAIGAVADLLNDFGESGAYRLDWIGISADGGADSTDGGFTGILGGGGTDVTAASGHTTMATIDYNDVIALLANAPAGVLERQCRWWMHPTILVKMMKIKDANDRPIFMSAIEAPSFGSFGSILGYPVTRAAAAPSTDSAGARLAAFGDPFGVGMRIRKGMTFDRSKEFSFDTDETTFRAVMRAGSRVKIATAVQVLKSAAS